jgi:alkylation response protein AidB-like acyl-CoA dehydrogenase
MDFQFSPDTLMLRDMLRKFVQKDARPLEMAYFTAGALRLEDEARLRSAVEQLGLWGATVPEKLGGGGLDTVTACVIEEELGGTFVPIDLGEVPTLLFECQGDQVARYLEPTLAGKCRAIVAAREPGAARPEGWSTSAELEDGAYRLTGTKILARAPAAADFFLVLARAAEGLSAFVLEQGTEGMEIRPDALLALRRCSAAMLGTPGKALAAHSTEAAQAWLRLGARYLGIAERLRAMAVEHARDWVALGEPLSFRPAVQRMLAEISVDVESARWLVYHAAWQADRGEPLRLAAAQVRLGTGEMLERTIDRVTMIYGGPGPSPEILPQRMARTAVPSETLQLALEYARSAVVAEVLSPEARGER